MNVIKIKCVDFWPGFVMEDIYLFRVLAKACTIEISEEPEILFYSCYGNSYLQYNCLRVFYTPENLRPDFSACDFAFSFDYLQDKRHYRLPLYSLHIERQGLWQHMLHCKSHEEAAAVWQQKKKFCCMVVSNGLSKKRIHFFQTLSKYKHVDSGGRCLNNVGGPVVDKLDFIKDYKFVIAFENSAYPGYTTEKILEPMLVDSIPIYWGNPDVNKDFNSASFLNLSDFDSEKGLIDRMLAIDADPELAISLLLQPKFPGNKIPDCLDEKNLLDFLRHIIDSKDRTVPVAKTFHKTIHLLRRKRNVLHHHLNRLRNKNFR